MKIIKLTSLIIIILLIGNSSCYSQTPSLQETEKFIKQSLEDYPWTEGIAINYIDFEDTNGDRIMKIHQYSKVLEMPSLGEMNSYYEFKVAELQSVTFEMNEVNIWVILFFKENKYSKHYQKELNTNEQVNKITIYLGNSAKTDDIPARLKKAFDSYLYQITGVKKSTAY